MASPQDTHNFETNSSGFHNSMNWEFAANAEGQNGNSEELNPEKAQRGWYRQQDQDFSSICVTAVQGIIEKPMPKEKGEAAASAKPSTGELPNPGERPARPSIFPASQKSKVPATEVGAETENLVIELRKLGHQEVMGHHHEQPQSDQRDVFFEPSLDLTFLEEHDSPAEIQKCKERNLLTEYPYSGRGWSGVDESGRVRFSQAEPVSQGLLSVSKPPSFTTNQVPSQSQFYSGLWHGYACSWTSNPLRSLYPSMGRSAFLARNSDQSCLSYHSSDSTLYSHSWPRPLETPQEGQSNSSHSGNLRSFGPEMEETRMPFQEIPSYPWRQHASLSLPQVPLAQSSQEGFIDSHCHLDVLYSKLSFKGSFSHFREIYSSSFPKEFQGCISNFCDPRLLSGGLWEEFLKEDMVWGTFGCCPNFARHYNNFLERHILECLRHPKAVGFGKMGLDYSCKCTTPAPQQHMVFARQLQLAVGLKKPLLIYCREAEKDMLFLLKKYVPADYKIHWICFIGSYATIEPFLKYFPNLFLGFTGILTYITAGELREALKEIPLERMLVESGAPFFLPHRVPKSLIQHSHPGLALYTVQEIARVKGQSLSHTLATLRWNTYRIYNV
ncbi:putative deoxyribonuclease TATDN2 [Manis pentadactyla]|uniref:putative deoxyribonuclease TATDN2 n=1 Tax=Manis pentadactyla TaxID=143292 RepID=UPI00255C87D4|nr:putative deoxyribonuclease TATDN2 [Manis pentadactyla]